MEKQLLIVDDDPAIREVIHDLFEQEGYNVFKAGSGDECLKILEEGFRGVILMDIMMPKKNGWDTIRDIVEMNYEQGLVIAMLTGLGEPTEPVEDLQEYVVDYITKPFKSRELVEIVDEYFLYLS